MRLSCILLLVFNTLALLAYPFVLMANIMAVAAVQPTEAPTAVVALAQSVFLWCSTLYPLPWLIALTGSLWTFRKKIKTALLWQCSQFAYLTLVLLSFILWLA